jgi:hypothetical protein
MNRSNDISFVLSMILTNEVAIETAIHTYIFINQILNQYPTSESWESACAHIYNIAEHYSIGATRLPYLNLVSRAAAKKEQRKWSRLIYQVTNEYPHVSQRVQGAKSNIHWTKNVHF